MPIINDTAPVYHPKNNYTISKYLDLTKFISLLSNRALFFCRLDKLEDQFEGVTAKRNFELRVEWYNQTNRFLTNPLNDAEILKKVEEMYEYDKKIKEVYTVCCWNKAIDESVALWKIYSDYGKGIMIKSNVSNLVQSLSLNKEAIYLSEINYIDYNQELMKDGNSFFPIIHKQKQYKFENELRLIHSVDFPQIGKSYEWEKEFIAEGKLISVNLDILIDQIIIGPFAPNWMVVLIEDLLVKYGFSIPVKRSEILS
jgi:hypothetical protein